MATKKKTAPKKAKKVTSLLPPDVLSSLAGLIGPALVQILVNWLMSKKQPAQQLLFRKHRAGRGKAPQSLMPQLDNATSVSSFLLQLLTQFGPSILAGLAAQLSQNGDWLSKMVATVLTTYQAQILATLTQLLQTAAGQQAVADALSKMNK